MTTDEEILKEHKKLNNITSGMDCTNLDDYEVLELMSIARQEAYREVFEELERLGECGICKKNHRFIINNSEYLEIKKKFLGKEVDAE